MAELRWILLALCIPLILGIWGWGARRSRNVTSVVPLLPMEEPHPEVPSIDFRREEWGVPPFEPLSIKMADFDAISLPDRPMLAHAEAVDGTDGFEEITLDDDLDPVPTSLNTISPATPATPAAPAIAAPAAAAAAAVPTSAKASELQKIVSLRVCAEGEERWLGNDLKAAFDANGLAFGRYHIFHRKNAQDGTLYCVASILEPGTFDLLRMPTTEFRGVTLFAVFPGPGDPVLTLDDMIATARNLAHTLSGVVQDSKTLPLSPQRAASLREEVERFRDLLPV